MRHVATTSRIAFILSLAALSVAAACSGNAPLPGGTGGIAASGGALTSSGGAPSSSGGAPSSSGGAPSSSGGGPATGGVANTGGGTGSGGAGAAPGAGGGSGGTVPEGVYVDLAAERQIIRGFGLNSALAPVNTLPWDDLYTTDANANSIGLSILRVGMNPDGSLTGFGVQEVKDRGGIVIGSTWTPPASWKDPPSEENGGHVLESYYEQWADRIATFAADEGLYAMSIANESDFKSCPGVPVCTVAYDTTEWFASEMVEFVKVARESFDALAPNVLMIAPEASEWIHVWSNISGTGSLQASHPHSSDPYECGCYGNVITPELEATCAQHCKDGDGYDYGHFLWADQEAWNAFDILGVHEYDSQIAFAWPADVNDGVRNKEVWQTEMSGVMHWPEQGPSMDIANGIAVAGWIHSAMTVGEASAWLYWWYEAYYENDNEGLALLKNRDGVTNPTGIAKRYYALGNYSKFVRPDYHAVVMGGNSNADVLVSAYKGDTGEVVVVAINKSAAEVSIPITIVGGTAPAMLTPTRTSATENLIDGTPVPVTEGVFTATLAGSSVTTFH